MIDHCLNCRRLKQIHYRQRCAKCYRYLLRTGRERPYYLQVREDPKPKLKPPPMCDCGRGPATQTITIRYGRSGRMKARIRLCQACYELETT